jgi:Restriction endonuclease
VGVAAPCLRCGEPTPATYCPECEAARPGTDTRLRSRLWRRLSAAYKRLHPLCEWPGCYRPTEIIDHKVPRDQGGSDTWANCQGLCRIHHAQKTKGDTAA